ncbi:DNA-binding IclR family transcriptional regulator [Rhodoligotrophos appendicifer]|uniref:IclR family transcriptional regulator n=1 Tax=Rhodoligotrophos appendicifer TaxID=987056 RepID=UPI0014788877|nr:IclR family transcriptional regulator [Rhodoligotrophos appendicifer]
MSVKALGKSLAVLKHFAIDDTPLGVTDLAEATGMTKGQISKILSTFREAGLLTQDPETRRYSVGLQAFALGARFMNSHRLAHDAPPIMRALVEKNRQSARLSIAHGDDVLYIYGIEGPLLLQMGWQIGTWMPLHATAAGKAVAAFFAPDRLALVINRQELTKFTENTVVDRDRLSAQLEDVRRLGWARNRGELTPGVAVIAVPIFNRNRIVTGALSQVYPEHLVGEIDDESLVDDLHDAAKALSARLGCLVYPFGGHRRPNP